MLGDFNWPDINWNADEGRGGVKSTTLNRGFHDKALEMIHGADLCQLVKEPTHKRGNTLDLVMINKALLDDVCVDCSVLPYISDHNMILVNITTQHTREALETEQKRILNFKLADYNVIEEKFQNLKGRLEEDRSMETMWQEFKKTCTETTDCIPGKLPKPKGHPWINRDLVKLIRKGRRVYATFKRFPGIETNNAVEMINDEIKSRTKEAKAKFLAEHVTEELSKGNTKPMYNFIKKHSGHSNHIASINDANCNQIPNALANHFSAVFQPCDFPTNKNIPEMDQINVSRSGIKALLLKLDPRKAGGPDNITAAVLKNLTMYVPSRLCLYDT